MKEAKTVSDIFNRGTAAEYLTINKATLDKLDIPRIRLGRRVVYRKVDIDVWLETQKKQSKAQHHEHRKV